MLSLPARSGTYQACLSRQLYHLKLVRWRYPVQKRSYPLANREDGPYQAFLGCGIAERSGINRLITGVLIELLDNFASLVVSAPQVAWCRTCLAEPVVQRSEIDVERLGRWTVRLGLHELRVGAEARWRINADPIGGIDHRLAHDSL